MQLLSRILLPVDFSERSVGAAHYARLLASHFHSEIILLHVTPPEAELDSLAMSGTMSGQIYRDRDSRISAELDSFVATQLAALDVRRVVVEGDPAARIIELANRVGDGPGTGLIIMPTHGYGPFRRFILGSNTAKVLHEAQCPVWTGVHTETAPRLDSQPMRHILCAIDLGPQSSRTLCWAAQLALEFGARLFIVHATGAAPEPDSTSEENWENGIHRAAEGELRRLGEFVHADAEVIVDAGDPDKVICAAAERIGADVLVIGRGSAAGVFGRLRANAHAIIRMSPCPVVSV